MNTSYNMSPKAKALTGSRKKTIFIRPQEKVSPRGGWSGGSCSYFSGLNYVTGTPHAFEQGDNFSKQTVSQELPANVIMIETGTFNGKPAYPAIYCRPEEKAAVLAWLGIQDI